MTAGFYKCSLKQPQSKNGGLGFFPIFCGNLSLFNFEHHLNKMVVFLYLGCLESQAVGMGPYLVITT